ncbi:MAG: hypothetical protein V7641_567 [Blastocatellia bacterium]
MKRIAITFITFILSAGSAYAQKAQTPSAAALSFYRALKEKRYVEGFHHSVYRGAVEGLSAAELQELEPDFARTFAQIPDQIEAQGEQINGDSAVVTLKFAGTEQPQTVTLIHAGGEWLVGDQAALAEVKQQGRAYFFNARMLANEDEVIDMLQHIIGAEVIYGRNYAGRCAPLAELIRLGGVPRDMETGVVNGYRYAMTLSADQSSFTATAVPVVYSKTGRLSFYADLNGIRAQDLKGQPATVNSPLFQPK